MNRWRHRHIQFLTNLDCFLTVLYHYSTLPFTYCLGLPSSVPHHTSEARFFDPGASRLNFGDDWIHYSMLKWYFLLSKSYESFCNDDPQQNNGDCISPNDHSFSIYIDLEAMWYTIMIEWTSGRWSIRVFGRQRSPNLIMRVKVMEFMVLFLSKKETWGSFCRLVW